MQNDKYYSKNIITRICISNISIMLLALLILIPASSAVTITPSNNSVVTGQSFDLTISIDPQGTPISGAQLNFEFDRSVLRVNSVTEGTLFNENGDSTFFNEGIIDNFAGTIVNIFGVIIGNLNVTTSGTFININMTAIGSSGTSGINLSDVKISDHNGNPVAANVNNGIVSINNIIQEMVISNITVTSGKNYILDTLAVGKLEYIDRTYPFNNVPSSYANLHYIRTANNDKASNGTSFIQFDVNKDVIVYIAHDNRITLKPSWLNSFTDTGDNLVSGAGTFSIFAKNYTAGNISLGGNSGSGKSMYSVILRPNP